MTRVLPAEWAEPPAAAGPRVIGIFGRLGIARRQQIARRAYEMYLGGRTSTASAWQRALGEDRMRDRRPQPW